VLKRSQSRGSVKSLWSQHWSTRLHVGFPKHVRQPEDRALAAPTHPPRSVQIMILTKVVVEGAVAMTIEDANISAMREIFRAHIINRRDSGS
jgi:hypothetical protein